MCTTFINLEDENLISCRSKLLKDKFSEKDIFSENEIKNLKPRSKKSHDEQSQRTRQNAEVFTPAWLCEKMIDYFDEKVKDLSFEEYIDLSCIEIACGEAPFIVSRYDAVTGQEIKIENRVGLLDRKLKKINENIKSRDEWLKYSLRAFKSVYGYELQADSLAIARLNLFVTFIEYYDFKWPDAPKNALFKFFLAQIVDVIAWNFWQMDGLEFFDAASQENRQRSIQFEPPTSKRELKIIDWQKNIEGEILTTVSEKKFDFCISNPPYHEETKDTSDSPVYNLFMDMAFQIADVAETITPARFLFNAGKTPKAWNEKMLNDPHLKVLMYEPDSKKIFRNSDIKGGVAVTYRDKNKNFGAIKTFSAFEELNSILHRVVDDEKFKPLDDLVITQNKWDLDKLYSDYPELKMKIGSDGRERRLTTSIFSLTEVFHDEKFDDDVTILGLINNRRTQKYVNHKYLAEHENINKYKVILPKSNGSGAIGEVLSTPLVGEPLVGEPLVGYTQSFIGIGKFDTQNEAEALFKYIKTKFARCMLGILKVTQDNNKGTWKYVPLQNFKNDSDIDWSKSIHEIDEQLYKKYGLSDNEIEFIESHVKEMK
ncbi:MAG: Eco57I restriction-modification methylase domain-containing protein [Synergistaceae bacterium]|nr:Eco57I restriction-modification methylase domain-containing protein [Synergistaceae bacterium]